MRKRFFLTLFILPVFILLPHLTEFPFLKGSIYSDLAISHYPNGWYLQQALLHWRTIPLWSPTILSGYPFAANPLSGLAYPPGWLALLFPLPLGFNLVSILHLIFGGVGMYCLLRAEGLGETAALLGALTFEAMPKLFSHLGAGHLTLIYAVTWTPWLFFAEHRSKSSPHVRWILPGAVLGMIALADVRWAAYAGLAWVTYALYLHLAQPGKENQRSWLSWGEQLLSSVLFAGLAAAPLLVPLAQYTRLSTRSALTAADNLTLSMPVGQLLGLVYPPIAGTAEWMFYPGALAIGLTIYLVCIRPARRQAAFWLVMLLVTLLFSLGANFPLLAWAARLPGLNMLRVPPRALFLTGMAFAAVTGYGWQALASRITSTEAQGKDRANLLLFSITAFVFLLSIAAALFGPNILSRVQFLWGGIFLLLSAALIFIAKARRISSEKLMVLAFSLSLINMIGVNGLSLDFRQAQSVMAGGERLASFLHAQAGGQLFRVYSPSYSIPQDAAARYDLQLVDGVDPLQLADYARYMTKASGVPAQGYSVTQPPFATGDPELDNQKYIPNAKLMALLNVRYVVSAYPMETQNLRFLAQVGQSYVYENELALPRVWIQKADAPAGEQILSEPVMAWSPNQIKLTTNGPGRLVLSELDYPGWQVQVDGKVVEGVRVANIFRGVDLQAGKHEVTFTFCPLTVYTGWGLGGIALIVLISTLWLRKRGQHG